MKKKYILMSMIVLGAVQGIIAGGRFRSGRELLDEILRKIACRTVQDGLYLDAREEIHDWLHRIHAEGFAAMDVQYLQAPMHQAARNGDLNVLKLLRRCGVSLESKNGFSETPLHIATEEGQYPVVKFLIDSGADVNTTDHMDRTPLHVAAYAGYLEIVKLLIGLDPKRNVNVSNLDVQDREKNTALHLAAIEGHAEILDLLVKQGATIMQDDAKKTPLSAALGSYLLARSRGKINSIAALIKFGVPTTESDREILDVYFKTWRDWLKKRKDIVQKALSPGVAHIRDLERLALQYIFTSEADSEEKEIVEPAVKRQRVKY